MSRAGRQGRFNRRQQGFDAGDDVQRGSVAGFQDGHQRRALAIDADDVGLRRKAVADVGDVMNVDGGGADGLDGQVVQFSNGLRRAVHIHFVFEGADFGGAGGKNQVLEANSVDDVVGRKAFRLQRRGIEVHLNLALLAAVGIWNRGAGNADQSGAHEIQADVAELLLGEAFASKRELQNGNAGGVVLNDQRGRGSRGELAQEGLRNRGHLRDGIANLHAGMKKYFYDANSIQGLRFDVFDVVDGGGEYPFVLKDDAVGHFLGRETGVVPQDADDRDINVGENVRGSAQNRDGAQN